MASLRCEILKIQIHRNREYIGGTRGWGGWEKWGDAGQTVQTSSCKMNRS